MATLRRLGTFEHIRVSWVLGHLDPPLVDGRAPRGLPVFLDQSELLIHPATNPDTIVAAHASNLDKLAETRLRLCGERGFVPGEIGVKWRRGHERALIRADGLAPMVRRDRVRLV